MGQVQNKSLSYKGIKAFYEKKILQLVKNF